MDEKARVIRNFVCCGVRVTQGSGERGLDDLAMEGVPVPEMREILGMKGLRGRRDCEIGFGQRY